MNSIVETKVMNQPQTFTFENFPVRTVKRDGAVWFVAADVCKALEHTNPRKVVDRLDGEEKNTVTISDGIRGNPNVNIISESGLYFLILTSRKPQAKRFKKWVTSEVLPAIRRDGGYILGEEAIDDGEELLSRALLLAEKKIGRLRLERDKATQNLLAVQPKVQAWETFINADGLYGLQNAGRALGVKPKLFIDWLKGKYLFRQSGDLVPKQVFLRQGLFEVKNVTFEQFAKLRTYITPKGLERLSQEIPHDLRVVPNQKSQ